MSSRQDVYDRLVDDRPSRDTFAHAHVIGESHNNNMSNQRHLQQTGGGDGMQNLIHNFKKFSFPAMDEYTRIELEQDRRRKSSTERPKSGSYPSEYHLKQIHSGAYAMDGGEMRRRTSREYLVADDDDEDNFMILSTRENRDNIVIRDEYNILNDDLKERRRSQSYDREEFPVTMVPICDIDYISGVPESAENAMWRQNGVQDLRPVREFTQIEHTETRSQGNQTAGGGGSKERRSSKATTFMSKNEVRDLLHEFNEDYRRNTEVLVKEMRESTSTLIRNFQETVTFSFREITATLKEMEEQNNRLNIRNNDVLSEDVELLYNKIMEDNQEIKAIVANLMATPLNNTIECVQCQHNDIERERRKSSCSLGPEVERERRKSTCNLGPEEKIKDMEVRFDRSPERKMIPIVPVVQLEKVTPPKERRLDDYICEIVVCPSTKICTDEVLLSSSMECAQPLNSSVEVAQALTASMEYSQAVTGSVECAEALAGSVECAQSLTGSVECGKSVTSSVECAQPLSNSVEYAQALSGSFESTEGLTTSTECTQAREAALNARNIIENEALTRSMERRQSLTGSVERPKPLTPQQASCVKANICEVKEKLNELRRKSLGELVVVEQITTNCSSEEDWFKNLKTIHKSVHNGI